MNSEELELSLRTEFESHLKSVVADMRQELSQFQEKVEAEVDKHKSQLDAAFQEFSAKLGHEKELEPGFAETVVEHLRLARDEGARITATAFAAAEELDKQTAADTAPQVGISELSAAINDITAQNSQATILKTLVQHAAQFTPRGAFFIIKNEHFVGWRVFGKEGEMDEQIVREVFFPVASSTALGESVRSLSAVESSFGAFDDDSIYLNKLEFGQPDRMYAIPLVARGRGVAVLYADYGTLGEEVNVEALETLVRVAGLTVEVLAGPPVARTIEDSTAVSSESYEQPVSEESREEYVAPETTEDYQAVSDEQTAETQEVESEDYAAPIVSVSDDSVDQTEAVAVEEEADQTEAVSFQEDENKSAAVVEEEVEETEFVSVQEDKDSWSQPAVVEESEEETESYQPIVSETDFSIPQPGNFQFSETPIVEEQKAPQYESAPFETVEATPVEESSLNGRAEMPVEVETFEPVISEPVVSEPVVAAPPVKSRFSDRNVDLPIEVGEDERRLHNDARRFARLLVSEIKLYNEQKVKEGREAQDLYERLREAIDRSRDMYDKRVQPPVAAKFDYFHYELVSSLAEGEETKLGGTYPGAAVN